MIGVIGIIMSPVCLSVCLSGTLCFVAKRYSVHPTVKVSEQVNRKCHPRNKMVQFSTAYTDPELSLPTQHFQRSTIGYYWE